MRHFTCLNNFIVTNTGALTATSVSITGGSINIGSNFSVNTNGNLYAASISTSGASGSYNTASWAVFAQNKINLIGRDDVGGSGYDIKRFLSAILFAPTRWAPMAIVYHTFNFSGNGTQTYDFKDEGVWYIACAVAGCSTGSDQIDCRWSGTTVTIVNNNGSCYVGVIAIGYADTYE